MHRAKEKKMAYILHYEFGYTKKAIAELMKISPQQMGQWIKEASYEFQINNLQNEIMEMKQQLIGLGYQPQIPLKENVIDIIEERY